MPRLAPSRLGERAPWLLAVLLLLVACAWLAWQSAQLIRLLRSPVEVGEVAGSAPEPGADLERLEPLFGPSPRGQGSTPQTNLNLTLLASFVAADPARSTVILQRSGEPARRFSVDERIDDNTRIHAVYRDRIEIERNGRIEQLSFPATRIGPADRAVPDESDGIDGLPREDEDMLRQRMEELRQQMEQAMLEAGNPTDSPEDE